MSDIALERRVLELLERAHGNPVFLVTRDADGLALHSMEHGDTDALNRVAQAEGIGRVTAYRHGLADLSAPRDLETMVARLTHGRAIVHDPVGGILAAQGILAFWASLGKAMRKQMRGAYFDRVTSRLCVWIHPSKGDGGSIADVRRVMEVADAHRLDLAITVSAIQPRGAYVPVDGTSARALLRARSARRWSTRIASVAALAGLGSAPALAQDMKVEGTIGATGGVADGDAFGRGTAQLGAVGDIYLQVDVAGLVSESSVSGGGVGGQFGYLDPDRLRAGVFGYGWKLEDYKGWKYGAYGELYLDNVTFRLEGGRIDGEYDDPDTYARAKVTYYMSEYTKIFAEGGTLDDGWGGGGVEHAFSAMPGLVAGLAGRFGNDEESARIYVKWYFGGPERTSSLKSMDRSGLAEPLFEEYEMRRTVKRGRAATSYGGGSGGGETILE
jgi:hypothetical protein